MDFRINEIKTQYLVDFENDKELIEKTVKKLEKYISESRINMYMDFLKNNNFNDLIQDLCENYYDRNYKLPKENFTKIYNNNNSIEIAKQIAKDFEEYFV